MNHNSTSQYMDKQIMDLSNSQSSATANSGGSNTEFIDFMNRPADKKEEIVPSYDFMPIRPAVGSSSPKAVRSANFDSDNEDAPLRTWNSLDSKTNSSPIRNYGSLDADDPAKFVLGKNHKTNNVVPPDGNLVSDIERTLKKHMDNLMHAVDNMSSRLSQLETRTRNLEHSIDDLKVSVGNNHGSVDGKMRLLENILYEVQSGVKVIKDKQEIFEAQLQISKLQLPKAEQVESKIHARPDSTQTGVSVHHQFTQPPPPAVPPPPPQQNLQPQVQHPSNFSQNQIPQVQHPSNFSQNQIPQVQHPSNFPPPTQTPENQNQQYQIPPPQQPQHSAPPPPPPQQHQYQPQHSSPPPPQYSQMPPPPPPQQLSSFSPVNPSVPQQPMGHLPEETLHAPPQGYSVGAHPPHSHPPTGAPPPPSQQYYGPTSNVYEPPPNRPGSGYSGSFGPSSGHGEPFPYSSLPSPYGSGSPVKSQQLQPQSGGSGYPQLPTARILPQALPTASAVGGGSGSGSGGSGNRVPIDDVVERVTNMGFPRDQVRATVRKLTENGQAVDLNIVLDKLMNDGDGQGQRGWFGR